MYFFILSAVLAIISAIIRFVYMAYKGEGAIETCFSEAGCTFFIVLLAGCVLSLPANLISSAINADELYKTETYPITKIEGYDKYAYITPTSSQSNFAKINLTYISDDQPVNINDTLSGIKIHDLEQNEKPCVVIKHYKTAKSNWTLFNWNTKHQEVHINSDQIGIIYEKQKKVKVEQE